MKTAKDTEDLERLIVQLNGLHAEISQLVKKSPNDSLNKFKLSLVNDIIGNGNKILSGGYKPFQDFDQFDSVDMPTNSDVALILTQYIEQAERFRSDNVTYHEYEWVYMLNGKASDISAKGPTLVGTGKK